MEERLKYLFQRYLDNTCTRKEFDEFLAFVGDAGQDESIRELIKKLYDDAGTDASSYTYVDESGNLVLTQPEWFEQAEPGKNRSTKKLLGLLAIAACGAVVVGYSLLQPKTAVSKKLVTNTGLTRKSTERSEYKYLLLPDSTQVWLNAESRLDFPQQFDNDKRIVILSGEAYFDVKHADEVPFIIQTGKVTTTVLGTAFNIKAYPGRKDVIVSVSRGKVKVNFNDKEVATLIKGQRVKVSHTDIRQVEKKPMVNEPAAWQLGLLAYDDETIEDIMADLERVYDVRIRISDEPVSQMRITTTFEREKGIEQALQVLCKLTETNLKQADGQYTIQ
jgi:ferric-dicitrate binding protein FerR (iron transport regulator)